MARECNIWSKFRHHCVHEINGRSSDVVCKIMFHLVCWYIFNYVFPPVQQRGPGYTNISVFAVFIFLFPGCQKQVNKVLVFWAEALNVKCTRSKIKNMGINLKININAGHLMGIKCSKRVVSMFIVIINNSWRRIKRIWNLRNCCKWNTTDSWFTWTFSAIFSAEMVRISTTFD